MDNHTSPGSPPIQIQQQQTDEWIDAWIRQYNNLIKSSTKQPPVFPISQLQKQSIDLKVSLQMLLQDATFFVGYWTNVNTQFNDRRSFPHFLFILQMSGLDWHKYFVSECDIQDSDLKPSTQPNHVVQSHPDWVMANKYYCRSLALMRLLQEIPSKYFDVFRIEQASMLESFLSHLIKIQQEQRLVVINFSEQLEQLRCRATKHLQQFTNSDAASSSNDGNRGKCPSILSKHPAHLRYSLYIISRESTWLLKKLNDSCFTSPSFIKKSEKIAETIVDFVSEFKESKENKDILIQQFGNHIKRLQEEGVGKGTVIENLLGCLGDVCSVSMDDYYVEKSRLSSLDIESEEAAEKICAEAVGLICEAEVLICEARMKLHSCRFTTLSGGGSPLGNVTLWRILFESSVASLRLDLISKKWEEAVKVRARLLGGRHRYLARMFEARLLDMWSHIGFLLSEGERVLFDFVSMHRTVAEIAYMLGDAFTTGGAGMNSLAAPSQSENDEEKEMDMVSDFPWDNHNVPRHCSVGRFDDPSILLEHLLDPSWVPSACDPLPVGRYSNELILNRSSELILGHYLDDERILGRYCDDDLIVDSYELIL